ncbi:MAG: DUF1830 domain-containing protein [Xenococcaceae cyanobacterium MO_188.B19]|nr:DUF1830 domain-containing protein [Xenococcaceae cyanobacterium MO_188.B19]
MSSNWQTATAQPISKILCYYTNSSRKMQLIRVTQSLNLNSEKIVFPQQRIFFEAIPQGQLEIYTASVARPRFVQMIPCQNLQVNRVPPQLTAIDTIASCQDKSA